MKKAEISTRFAWLRAFCVIVALMSLVFLAGTGIILINLKQNIHQFTQRQAQISQSILEAEWENSFNYGMQLFYDNTVKSMEKTDLQAYENREDAYMISSGMYNHIITNPVIEDFYLYYPQSDYIIGARGVYAADVYGTLLHIANRDWDAAEWKNLIFRRDIGFFTVTENNQVELYYRLATIKETGRVLVAKFNMAEITNILEHIGGSQSNSLTAIVDDDMHIYGCAGDYDRFVDPETNTLRAVDKSKYFYADLASSHTPLRYIAVTEISAVCRTAEVVGWISVGCILLSTAAAFLLSFYFTNKNMQPLLRLLDRYGRKSNSMKNELNELEFQMDELVHENQEALISIEQQRHRHLAAAFLNECFKSDVTNQQSVTELAAIYDLSFENAYYVVVLQKRTQEYHGSNIIQLLEEWDKDAVAIYWTQQDDLDLFLINYDPLPNDGTPYQAFLLQLQACSGKLKNMVISKQTDNLEEIRRCWLDCLSQLKLPAGLSREESQIFQGQVLYNSFVKYLEDQEYASASNLVPELYSSFLICGTELERECKRYRIISLLLSMRETKRYEKMLQTLAMEPLDENWCDSLRKVLQQMQRVHQFRSLPLYDGSTAAQIRTFIDEEYSNPSLDLRMISEFIGLSESYVSKIFKKEYELGISQYLNMVRISQAKKWLKTDTLSIKAIALQVGYASDAHFIRIFKKLEGKTPGAYRYDEIDGE